MAREIQLKVWCDVCFANDEQVEGSELPPILIAVANTSKPRVLALCVKHRKALYEPLEAALREHGVLAEKLGMDSAPKKEKPPYRPPADPDDSAFECSECGTQSGNRAVVRNHLTTVHPKARMIQNVEYKYKCSHCELSFTTATGLGSHRTRHHGLAGVSATTKRVAAKKATKRKVLGVA